MISSERLRTFASFAVDANLSRAAKRLHLSQPAVHAQLKALAEEVGVPLYHRAGRGLVLTREGVEVAAFARELDERSSDLLARLRGEGGPRPLVLAAGAGAIVHLLARGLRSFTRSAPRTRVEVITSEAARALELVRSGIAHVGVGVIDAPADLEVQTVAHARQLVVVPRGHRLARSRSVPLSAVAGESLVMPPEGGPQRAALDAAFASSGITVHVAAIARGWDVVLRLVEIGVGIGFVNDTCAIPRTLVARRVRELPTVTYRAFTRVRPRAEAASLIRAFVRGEQDRAG